MYLTDMDFLNAKITAEGRMNESDIIRYILEEDSQSPQKIAMIKGENYYNAKHDSILKDYNKTEVSETEFIDGEEREVRKIFKNPNRSNHHNVDPFHKLLVDQKVSYIVGKEPTITVKGSENDKTLKEYENIITDFADEKFNETIQDIVRGASNKGFEALHIYYDEYGNLKYCVIPADEIIPIYDTRYQEELVEVIRYYGIKVIRYGREYIQRRVEWWKKDSVTYYIEKEPNIFVKDNIGICPHWWDINLINDVEKRRTPHNWGCVPFVILDNNKNRITDLHPIKGLIDAYDMISSEGTNNFLDLVELYWVIQGYEGETSSAISKKLQVNKAVNINDTSGKVEAKQVSLPVNERIEFLKMLRRDIYHFGMGIDIDDERFGTAPSGISLQFRYANLKHKCENMTPRLKRAIKQFLWFFTDDYNRKNNTSYDASLINITLNYSQIGNDAETVDIITKSEGIISRKTQLEHHPFITDVNEELKQLEIEEKQSVEKYSDMQFPQKEGDE